MTKDPVFSRPDCRPRVPLSLRSNVAPFLALDVLAGATRREREGQDIVHLEIGEPGAPPPRGVRDAAIAALDGRKIGYTEALGRPELAGADRPALPRHLWRCRLARADRRHDRLVGRFCAGVPRPLRSWRAGRDRGAGLSGLPQYSRSLRHRDGDDRDRAGRPFHRERGHDRGRAFEKEARRGFADEPGQSDRHDDEPRRAARTFARPASGSASPSFPTRFIMG